MTRELNSNQSHPLINIFKIIQLKIQQSLKTLNLNLVRKTNKIETISQQIKPLDHEGLFNLVRIYNKACLTFLMLDEVQSKDMGPVGDSLNQLMGKLKSVNPNDLDPNKQSSLNDYLEERKLL